MHPENSNRRQPGYPVLRTAVMACALGFVAGCAAEAPFQQAPPPPVQVAAIATPAPTAAPAAPRPEEGASAAVAPLLAYADRLRPLPATELALEITQVGDPADSPVKQMQLAIALGLTRVPNDTVRAQALLQRVLANASPEARPLQPLARLFSAQMAEHRKSEEQAEKQAQQLRDSQRRIDQLNERLEAMRAIERSLPARPRAPGSAPAANGQRPAAP
jgi:hypothetical protein